MENRKYKILVLLDHTKHNRPTISIYGLVSSMVQHPACQGIDVASKGHYLNAPFFHDCQSTKLYVTQVTPHFRYQKSHKQFDFVREAQLSDYDLILLRLHPFSDITFLSFLTKHYPRTRILNDPYWMPIVGSKDYLLRFPDLCPEMRLCLSIDEILAFAKRFPIVLKPLRAYGGKGVVRIDGHLVYEESVVPLPLENFIAKLRVQPSVEYLGMKYLHNVSRGDKRIIVVNDRIIGACLRMPPQGSWICNVSQEGTPAYAEPDMNEIAIAKRLVHDFKEKRIVIFGFDTLMDDNGNRVLSEINAFNVGGFVNAQITSGAPVIRHSANFLWKYICSNISPITKIVSLE